MKNIIGSIPPKIVEKETDYEKKERLNTVSLDSKFMKLLKKSNIYKDDFFGGYVFNEKTDSVRIDIWKDHIGLEGLKELKDKLLESVEKIISVEKKEGMSTDDLERANEQKKEKYRQIVINTINDLVPHFLYYDQAGGLVTKSKTIEGALRDMEDHKYDSVKKRMSPNELQLMEKKEKETKERLEANKRVQISCDLDPIDIYLGVCHFKIVPLVDKKNIAEYVGTNIIEGGSIPNYALVDDYGGRELYRTGDSIVVGRNMKSNLSLPKTISRKHIELKFGTDFVFITDLGSMNGSFLTEFNLNKSRKYRNDNQN